MAKHGGNQGGRPKGVKLALPEEAIDAPTTLVQLASKLYGLSKESVYLSPAPLYHAAPLRWCITVQHLGGTPDLRVFDDLVHRVVPYGWHVVLHFDAKDLVDFGDMLRKLPVPFIIDHMGRVPTKDGLGQKPFRILLETARMENCWVKICGAERISSSGPPFHDAVPFARAILEVAPERTLWGTDWPHPNIRKHMPNDGDLVDLIPLFMPDPAQQKLVLVDNPGKLYGFRD